MIETFTPECTFPDHRVNYVGSPPLRSTLGIVWPCVLTLVASIYTALHLDIIADTEATSTKLCECKLCKRRWLPNRICRDIRAVLVPLSIAAIALFAPEMIAQRAMMERYWSGGVRRKLKKIGKVNDDVLSKWTRTHGYYVNMGGFRLCCLGPFAAHNDTPEAPCDCKETVLSRRALALAVRCELLPQEPPISKQEILDHSKAGAFAKILAIWQMVWFLVDIVTRLARHLPIAQLEVGVAGFAMLALATYGLYFSKPKGVNIGTRVSFSIPEDPETCRSLRSQFEALEFTSFDQLKETEKDEERDHSLELAKLLRDETDHFIAQSQHFRRELLSQLTISADFDDDFMVDALASISFAGALALPFGAVHVAAWNASFPTSIDQWLWRISSMVSMLVLLLLYLYILALTGLQEKYSRLDSDWAVYIPFIGLTTFYAIARVILIVAMVRCMLFLPPQAFVTSWTTNVPHLG
ncbi:hypothetical protein E8E14_008810 [Neopestalotiopsis sp. 37M]|nr:hypothetical protein E8E14_008810 [Neopestalotiopsis sp. 37M]